MRVRKNILLTTSAAPTQTPFSTTEKRPPLGIGYLISVLRNRGHEVFFIDNYLEPVDFLDTDYLSRNEIDFIGIYANTICFRDTLKMLHRIEFLRQTRRWGGKIVVGGPHTSVAADTIPAFVDHVVQGEGEVAIVDIVEGRASGRILRYQALDNLDDLPMPAWDYFVHLPYSFSCDLLQVEPVFTMNTSRGCPFNCTFCSVCSIWGKRYASFSATRIVTEIKELIKRYGLRGVYFREDNFTLDKERLKAFCNLLLQEKLDIQWACESRVDAFDEDLLNLMYRAGARGMYLGVESGSQRILDFLKKGITTAQIERAFHLCNQLGIRTAASFIAGVPTETQLDVDLTRQLLQKITPFVTWANVFVGIPTSPLLNFAIENKMQEFIDDRGLVYLKGHNQRVDTYYRGAWDAKIPIDLENGSPRISVVMSAWNAEKHIAEAIKSIIGQSCLDYEFIIIDDASTDNTAGIVESFDDPRIRLIRNSGNLGLTASLNNGLQAARGEFIARMDADDVSLPHRFETQLAYLEQHPQVAVVGSSYYVLDDGGSVVKITEVLSDPEEIGRELPRQNWFCHGSTMIRKTALDEAGGYDPQFRYAQDYDLFLRLSEKYRLANIREPLYSWRARRQGISRVHEVEQQRFAQLARQRHLRKAVPAGESPLVSVVIPTRNRPHLLERCLSSIVSQTYRNYEVVVVNDAGCDVTPIIARFRRLCSISYVQHDTNKGLAAARNSGILASKGRYLAYLDDDDQFYPNHLMVLVTYLQSHPEIKVVYTDACRAHQELVNGEWVTVARDQPYCCDFDYDRILLENFIPVLCVVHDRGCFETGEMFDERLKRTEDWDLWLRLSRRYQFSHIKQTTCEFTVRSGTDCMMGGREEPFDWAALGMFHKYRGYTEKKPQIAAHHEAKVRDALDRLNASLAKEAAKPEAGRVVAELLCLASIDAVVEEAAALSPCYPAEQQRMAELVQLLRGIRDLPPPGVSPHPAGSDGLQPSPRLIAFHLPQYHRIPENDAWWGEGFTEWSNVVKAVPRFPGHHQPHEPTELGHYDLTCPGVMKAQADLARRYGIYGFCFYHYWFNGKLLLETPLHQMLRSGEPDFPFCLCWANEDWTRAWDGRSGEVLIKQNYSHLDDIRHFYYLATLLGDKRYIRVNGKPLLLVYRANLLPDPLTTSRTWRDLARKLGIGEIYLCRVESFSNEHSDPAVIGFDASVEFQPDWDRLGQPLQDAAFGSHAVFDYGDVVERMLQKKKPPYTRFPCVTPSWDNSARRKENATILAGSTPKLYEKWLTEAIRRTRLADPEQQVVFINAWNEWGEGNHLEPDTRHGRRYLTATRGALRSAQEAPLLASIIVPVFNHLELTRQCLNAISRNSCAGSYEIIVIDNGSTDGTREYLHSSGAGVTTISNRENLGFVAATNQGAAQAKGKYLVFLNNDTVPLAGWLESLIALAEGDPEVGAVGAKLVYPDGRLQEAGALIFSDGNGWNFGNGDSPERGQYNTVCEVDYCSGACLLVRRDLFAACGGLDERFSPAYYEETDLCFGVRKLGYKVMYNPDAVIVHHESATAGSDTGTGFKKYLQINREKFVEKWRDELLLQDPPPRLSGRPPKTADRKRLQGLRPAATASCTEAGNRQPVTVHQSTAHAPKALVFFPHNPYPPRTGAHQRCLSMLEALKETGCSLTLASSDLFSETPWDDSDIPLVEQKLGVTIHLYSGTPADRAYISQTRVREGELINWDFYVPPGLCCDFEKLCKRYQPDLVLINYAYWGRLISNAACRKAVKIIDIHDLLTVNIMMKLHMSRYLAEGILDPVSADAALLEEGIFDAVDARIGETECAIYESFDFVAAISSRDRELVSRRVHQAKTVLVPMALTVASGRNSYSGNPIFVISNNPFNLQGYLYFTARVLPEVLREVPQMTLNVVGNGCSRLKAASGVNLLGFVPDLKGLYAESKFAICPLLGGTGQQVKIVEAMAHGVPVVAMKAVAASSPISHGENGFIAGDAAEFASYVIRLYREPELARRLGRAARATIRQRFSREALSSRLKEMLTRPVEIATSAALACEGPSSPMGLPATQRILWMRCDSIGDNVLAASMLPHLRARYPQACITVFCQDHIAEIYKASPFVSQVIGFDRYRAHMEERYRETVAQRLQKVGADLALYSIYSRDPLYDWFTAASGARERVALQGDFSNISARERDANNKLFTDIVHSAGEHKPELARHRDFLKGIGIDAPALQPVIWITGEDHQFAEEFFLRSHLSEEKTVALFAGAQSPLRVYGAYGRALAALCREKGLSLVALGSRQDHDINQRNLDQSGARGINLCGKLSLRQSAAIIKRCRIAVGAETGLAHIACAVGTPNVILLGGGHFGRFMPYSPLTSVVCLPLTCYFCNWGCSYSRAHCVKDVHPAVITRAVRQALAGNSERTRVFCQSGEFWHNLPGGPEWKGCEELLQHCPVEIHLVERDETLETQQLAVAAASSRRAQARASVYKTQAYASGGLQAEGSQL